MRNEMIEGLLRWFGKNERTFYWRTHSDPYTVLIAEILLKKTTANAADRLLPVFLGRYPDIRVLHKGSITELQELLTPLGLSKQRAIQLKSLAKILVESHGGEIPCAKEELLKLPGVGDYTAGAILSFAYGMTEAIVDTNIARLVIRLFGIKPSRCEARRSPEVWEKSRELVGQNGAASKRVNWALLDLAAIICKSQNPLHSQCPVKNWCVFYEREACHSISKDTNGEKSPDVK